MEAKSNKTLLIVVCVIVVVLIIAVAGYFLLMKNGDGDDNDNEAEAKYWFYLDYGDYEGDNAQNGWISAVDGSTPLNGLFNALNAEGIAYDISSAGWIVSICGIEPDWTATMESWYSWGWASDSTWEELSDTLGNVTESWFYIGVTAFDEDDDGYNTIPALDPNSETEWQNGGPFSE